MRGRSRHQEVPPLTRSRLEAWLAARERTVLVALALLAALRVLLFGAAFPFFNNVDEMEHFDLVQKYLAGSLPRACAGPWEELSRELVPALGSPEWYRAASDYPDGRIPPPVWSLPAGEAKIRGARGEAIAASYRNKESCSPPVYYAVAALWWRAGSLLGLDGGALAYWLRFLNAPIVLGLMALAQAYVRRVWGEDPGLRIGVTALVAFLPTDTFYSINSDALSPLLFGAALLGLLVVTRDGGGLLLRGLTGIAIAATMLTKISNWVLAPLAAGMILFRLWKEWGGAARPRPVGSRRREIVGAAALSFAAGAPVAAWMLRNQLLHGELLAIREKTQGLGWTVKPLLERLPHALFTPAGAADALADTFRTFWRGEFIWNGSPMGHSAIDALYLATTALFLAAAGVVALRRDPGAPPGRRLVLLAGFSTLVHFFAFFAWSSIRYEYGDCLYPSRDRPYLRSGRLMLGGLLPLALLYVEGLRVVTRRLAPIVPPLALLAGLLGVISASELLLTLPVFSSPYNWFHMP
jgi:hypothetical protein